MTEDINPAPDVNAAIIEQAALAYVLANATDAKYRPDDEAIIEQTATVDDTALHRALLERCGYVEGDELSSEGSAQNDLADERVQVIMEFLDLVQGSTLPRKLLPVREVTRRDLIDIVNTALAAALVDEHDQTDASVIINALAPYLRITPTARPTLAQTRTGRDWCPVCKCEAGTDRYVDDDGIQRCAECLKPLVPLPPTEADSRG